MLEQKISCDTTGIELKGQDAVNMTICSIQYKHVDKIDVKDEATGKMKKQDFVKQVDNFAFHFCHEDGAEFMEMIKAWIAKKKGEHCATDRN